MANPSDLPAVLDQVELGNLRGIAPNTLLDEPKLALSEPPESAAARTLVFGRGGDSDLYDEIGFRTLASTPRHGAVHLQTFELMRREQRYQEAKQVSETIRRIQEEQEKLRHRPLAMNGSGDFNFNITRNKINIMETVPMTNGFDETRTWTFPLSDPPAMMMQDAIDDDAGLIAAQQLRVDIPGAHWLPFKTVVEKGKFPRFQNCRSELETETHPQRFYLFISHRWLSPKSPDPEDKQASFIAWQLTGYLCEAVRIAHWRGLDTPRKKSPLFGHYIGPAGSDLAESLIINLLRPTITPQILNQLQEEIRAVETVVADYGVSAARSDSKLHDLQALLDSCPLLSKLMDNIFLWYDYSCMPQEPYSEEELIIFKEALRHLGVFQVMGNTVILLDDAESYLSRAWCVLEALVADTAMNSIDILIGPERTAATDGRTETYFQELMADRPHFVWRAVLDTEFFAVQSARTCMRRLGLDATKSEDVDVVYDYIKALPAPSKIHVDESEIVTGIFPIVTLPLTGNFLIPQRIGRAVEPDPECMKSSIDWTDSLRFAAPPNEGIVEKTVDISPLIKFSADNSEEEPNSTCHVAIVGSCEGEACLIASTVLSRRAELGHELGLEVKSMSWIASDIAPVGHFTEGSLQAVPINATAWIVVTLDMRLRHCDVTNALLGALKASGHWYATLSIDIAADNMVVHKRSGNEDTANQWDSEAYAEVDPSQIIFPHHPGGLFRWSLPAYLAERSGNSSELQNGVE